MRRQNNLKTRLETQYSVLFFSQIAACRFPKLISEPPHLQMDISWCLWYINDDSKKKNHIIQLWKYSVSVYTAFLVTLSLFHTEQVLNWLFEGNVGPRYFHNLILGINIFLLLPRQRHLQVVSPAKWPPEMGENKDRDKDI